MVSARLSWISADVTRWGASTWRTLTMETFSKFMALSFRARALTTAAAPRQQAAAVPFRCPDMYPAAGDVSAALVLLARLHSAPERQEEAAEVHGGDRLALAVPDLAAERAVTLVVLLCPGVAPEGKEDVAEVSGGDRLALAKPDLAAERAVALVVLPSFGVAPEVLED